MVILLLVGAVLFLMKTKQPSNNPSNPTQSPDVPEDPLECWSDDPVSEDVTDIYVSSNRCNTEDFTVLDLTRFKDLMSIDIGSNSFLYVKELKITGLRNLERVSVGRDSFSGAEGSFILKDCKTLTELRIGNGAFARFNVLTLESLPALELIDIGGGCFINVDTFRVSGMKSLERMVVGDHSFTEKRGSFHLTNCRSLKEVTIEDYAFAEYGTFEVSSVPSLETISVESNCFTETDSVSFSGLDSLERVTIGDSCFLANGEFNLRNCPKVRELRVGMQSFRSYTVCIIENVPSLELIEMGAMGRDRDDNFLRASLELKSVIIRKG